MLWGIDLGGTKIEAVVLEHPSADAIVERHRIATEAELGYDHIVGRIAELIDIVSQMVGQRPKKVGIGTPGAIDPRTQMMKNSNTTCLIDMPFHVDVEKALGVPVVMANDANCFALAETLMGAVPDSHPDAKVVFGVIMGTGVGGGVVVDGKPINGLQGIAGEWGHNFLDASGGPCYCGKVGCVERIISGTALQEYYAKHSGTRRKLKEIIERARGGQDEVARETLERLIYFFGMGISSIINVLDPDVIILGGGVGNIDELYTKGVVSATEFVFNHQLQTPFVKPKLGDSAGVFGAALLVAD